jgi:hypothetical protein
VDNSALLVIFVVTYRLDLAEGIALRAGVNLDRLDNLVRVNNSSASEQLSPHSLSAHSRMLPELSLGSTVLFTFYVEYQHSTDGLYYDCTPLYSEFL